MSGRGRKLSVFDDHGRSIRLTKGIDGSFLVNFELDADAAPPLTSRTSALGDRFSASSALTVSANTKVSEMLTKLYRATEDAAKDGTMMKLKLEDGARSRQERQRSFDQVCLARSARPQLPTDSRLHAGL